MARTANTKNLEELFLYAIIHPYTGNGVIKNLAQPSADNMNENTRDADDVYTVADGEVIVRPLRKVEGGGSSVVLTIAKELAYDAQTGAFAVGETVTGDTSSATGVIAVDKDDGATGTLTLDSVTGIFQDDEPLTGDVVGAAVVNGTLTVRAATFSDGDPPDEGLVVTISGGGLSTTLVSGGVLGNKFEILRGRPTYTTTDYVGYVQAKSEEPRDITIPIMDKGVIQHRKERSAGGERQLSITSDYLNDKYGLLGLNDQDSMLIFEREDDLGQAVTEYHYYLQARSMAKSTPEEASGDDMSSIVANLVFERAYTLAGT